MRHDAVKYNANAMGCDRVSDPILEVRGVQMDGCRQRALLKASPGVGSFSRCLLAADLGQGRGCVGKTRTRRGKSR